MNFFLHKYILGNVGQYYTNHCNFFRITVQISYRKSMYKFILFRYHQLPEARFELIPPSTFLRKIKRQNSTGGMHRRSRSMETFRDKTHTETVKKFTSGSLRRNETE